MRIHKGFPVYSHGEKIVIGCNNRIRGVNSITTVYAVGEVVTVDKFMRYTAKGSPVYFCKNSKGVFQYIHDGNIDHRATSLLSLPEVGSGTLMVSRFKEGMTGETVELKRTKCRHYLVKYGSLPYKRIPKTTAHALMRRAYA